MFLIDPPTRRVISFGGQIGEQPTVSFYDLRSKKNGFAVRCFKDRWWSIFQIWSLSFWISPTLKEKMVMFVTASQSFRIYPSLKSENGSAWNCDLHSQPLELYGPDSNRDAIDIYNY